MIETIALLSTLAGFIVAGLFGRYLKDTGAQIVTCAGVILAAVCSLFLFYDVVLQGNTRTTHLFDWIAVGDFRASWSIRLDTLSVVMMNVITIVSACVHVYSIGYMKGDPSVPRFMAYLSLFTFAMMSLVTADNLLQLFFGWEGVGLASYLLIGFWHQKATANAAAIKAFLVNRVGDLGLVLGLFATFMIFGSIEFDVIFAKAQSLSNITFSFLGLDVHALTLVSLLLFIGAVGKSAQLGLHTWLPDAMEGPTPVSALIHAATMVTAGVFLVARFSPVFEFAPDALSVVCVVGALTAIVAATIGMTQFDIKRVIAYSTMSQLGYMFFALGVSAYSAAMFHLVTHAFFKALLFLGAGSVIHALHHEQDLRKMGGVWKKIPFTYAMMWIGSLALAGVPFFAGFYSKDLILEAAYASSNPLGGWAYFLGVIAAVITAFYSARLIFMAFHGAPRMDHHTFDHAHEPPLSMRIPLGLLAVGAVISGFALYEWFAGHERAHFWDKALFVLPVNDTVEAAHHVEKWVKYLPILAGVVGLYLGYLFYSQKPGLPAKTVESWKPLHALFFNKYFIDELYTFLFVRPALFLGRVFWKRGDQQTIDAFGPDGVAWVTRFIGAQLSRLQTGFVYHYAFVMMAALIALLLWVGLKTGLMS